MTWPHALLTGLIFGVAELALLGFRQLVKRLITRRKSERPNPPGQR